MRIENIVFVGAFAFIMYDLISTYGLYIYNSIKGKGYWGAVVNPILNHRYYASIVSIIIILNTTLVFWEIGSLVVQLLKHEKDHKEQGGHKYKRIFKKVAVHYKSSFLTLLLDQLLPKVIVLHMFGIWLPYFQKLQLFTINLSWYSWVYAYICWEFSAWLFHYSSHRVRFLWCIHSPHHAPSELNMTVNWIHFFAESYYSTFVLLIIMMIFGINPAMAPAIIAIDAAWGIFIHVSENALKDGRLGIFQHLLITPAHHRVHHAKNPLYLDTNFASAIPLWDWIMGTLQPLRDEVRTEYGITRDLDVTNFSDLYFGEFILLYMDIKNAAGLKNKLLYIFMPPGWTPVSKANTAAVARKEFLEINPGLGVTSREKLVTLIKSRFKGYNLKVEENEVPVSTVVEIK